MNQLEEESVQSDETNDVKTLATVVRAAIRRYFPVVIVCTVLGGLAGYGFSMVSGRSYTATSSVIVRPAPGNPLSPQVGSSSGNQLTVSMATEVSLVTTPVVAAKASALAHKTLPGPNDSVSATVPPSTQIVLVTYTAPTAQAAQDGANAYAQAFLDFRADNAKSSTDAQLKALNSQLAAANTSLKTAAAQAASNTDPRSYAAQELQLYAERIASLNNSISTATSASLDPGAIVRKGVLPTSTNGLPAILLVVAGALLGAIIGGLGAVTRQLGDKRIRSADEPAIDGLPILAATTTPMHLLGAADHDDTATAALSETFRQLRTAVTTSAGRGTVVALTSLQPSKPSGVLAYNLGTSLTHAGYHACVVDLDTSQPPLHSQVSAAAAAEAGLQDPMAGSAPDDFAGPSFRARIDELRATHDFTILAVAPSGTADGDAGASLADATVLIASENKSTRPQVQSARARVLRLGAPALGLLCVGPVPIVRPNQPPARRTAGEPADAPHVVHD